MQEAPVRRLRLSDEGAFEEYISQQLGSKHMHRMTDGTIRIFKRKIFEVYQNAVIHSESKIGIFVSGQLFPQQNRLDFTVADAGIGIRGTVRRYFKKPGIGSIPALKWALEPSNTTKRGGPRPGGLGFQFLQHFSRMNKGKIQIASRFGFMNSMAIVSPTMTEIHFGRCRRISPELRSQSCSIRLTRPARLGCHGSAE